VYCLLTGNFVSKQQKNVYIMSLLYHLRVGKSTEGGTDTEAAEESDEAEVVGR